MVKKKDTTMQRSWGGTCSTVCIAFCCAMKLIRAVALAAVVLAAMPAVVLAAMPAGVLAVLCVRC